MITLFGDGDQDVGAERRPDLDTNSVGGSAEEPTQSEMLLEPAKECFDRPALFINLGDHVGLQSKLIGDKDKGTLNNHFFRKSENNRASEIDVGLELPAPFAYFGILVVSF